MIDAVIRYLHDSGVPFRVASYPAPEQQPPVAHRFSPGTIMVDVHIVLVEGRPALACTPAGVPLSLAAVAMETGTLVTESSSADLHDQFRGMHEPVPPLGGVFGVPLFLDERIALAPALGFRAFALNDFVEVPYEPFAVAERPRVAAFAERAGLPPHG